MAERIYAHRTSSQWQQHIDSQAISELNAAAYCKQHNLTPSNFYHWRTKLNTSPQTSKAGTELTRDNWLAITPVESPLSNKTAGSEVTLALPGSITLTIKSA